jgi:GNAT superfamily N-acetyltransferase
VAAVCFDRFIRPYYSEGGVQAFAAWNYPGAIAKRQSIDCRMFIADLDGRIAGFIEMRGGGHISMLFVDPEFHNCGIATRLFERALRTAVKLNPGLSGVTVYSAPGAVEVYRHWGFAATGPETERDGIRFTPMSLSL